MGSNLLHLANTRLGWVELSIGPVILTSHPPYLPLTSLLPFSYVGNMYESPKQTVPTLDAKGIESVRRDGCPAVSKLLEQSLRMLFSGRDLSVVKAYVEAQWTKILSNRVSIQDFVFAREVR